MIAVILIFSIALLLILHSYVLYPIILQWMSQEKKLNTHCYDFNKDKEPKVYIIFAAYNEEKVLDAKLASIAKLKYQNFELLVGSDGSTDRTDHLLELYCQQHENARFYRFDDRAGKANVLNKIIQKLKKDRQDFSESVLVFTDANIIFHSDLLTELVKHFKNERIGQVGANILNEIPDDSGIAKQEAFYIQRENRIKYLEGLMDGHMIGAFGACYAMRAKLYPEIPTNYLMEDFYISMHILSGGYKAILEPQASCYEALPSSLQEEYKRKIRISAGNYQNLKSFSHLLFPPWEMLGFAFISHKLLRWISPFLLIIMYICSAILSFSGNSFFQILLILQTVLICLPILDGMMRKLKLNSGPIRYPAYFYAMNVALLAGFFKYLKGVQTNVWQPTKRS